MRHADGAAARSLRRRLPEVARWRRSACACCSAAAPRRSSATTRSKAWRSRTADASRPTSSWSPPASGRTWSWAARPGSTSTAASSSTTTWRRRDPDIFAVGECVEHNGICYGLVAPLLEQGKVLAATITGNKGPTYTGHRAGRQAQDHGRRRVLRRRLGGRRRRRAGALRRPGARRLQEARAARRQAGRRRSSSATRPTATATWTGCARAPTSRRSAATCCFRRPTADAGLDVAEMADSATVCGCVGVTKGTIIHAIHENGVNTLSQLKEAHARQHRLRQLHGPVPGPAPRRRAGVRGGSQEGAVRLRAVRAGQPARDPAQPAAASRCRRCSTSTATAWAARSASRR